MNYVQHDDMDRSIDQQEVLVVIETKLLKVVCSASLCLLKKNTVMII